MPTGVHSLKSVLEVLVAVGLAGWGVFWTIRKAVEPRKIALKWVLTAPVLWLFWGVIAPSLFDYGAAGAVMGIFLLMVLGWVLVLIWGRSICGGLAHPFEALYSGGNAPAEPEPAYSVALARLKQGDFPEAEAEVRRQLEQFPTDFEGLMLLARIQAEHLKDLPAARRTVLQACSQTGRMPRNIAYALHTLADWEWHLGGDVAEARRALEWLVELLPGTEFALAAAQRIAHLSEATAPPCGEPRKLVVPNCDPHLGLNPKPGSFRPQEKSAAQRADELVRHLQQYPLDAGAREELAEVYVRGFGHLELAALELEQLIAQPGQPMRLKVKWLNLLANLQIQYGAQGAQVCQTLQRIIELNPTAAAAVQARQRLAVVQREIRGRQAVRTVPLSGQDPKLQSGTGPESDRSQAA